MEKVIKYFGIAFAIALFVVLYNVIGGTGEIRNFGMGMGYLFWMTLGPGLGMLVGAFVREWLMPSAFYTTGGIGAIFKTKLFWAIGPQGIGWLIGLLAVGNHLM